MDPPHTPLKDTEVVIGNERQTLIFCRKRIEAASHAHFAPDAGVLIRLAWECGPSHIQSSIGPKGKPCTTAARSGDVPAPSSDMLSMAGRRGCGCPGPEKRLLSLWWPEVAPSSY